MTNAVLLLKARPLAVTTANRTDLWPELPTVAESGLPGYAASVWFGLFAPAATPREVLARLSAEVRTVMAEQETRDWLQKQGAIPVGDTPEATATNARANREFLEKVLASL